jgi:DNA-binding transcriptional ArsR family regulator
MERQDMAALGRDLGISERLFLTRQRGEQAYQVLKVRLQALNEGQALILLFPPDQLMDASFADETIVRLGEEIASGNFGERSILLENLTEDSITNLNSIIKFRQLKLAFLAVEPNSVWQCVGQLEPSLRETLEFLSERNRLTAPELGTIKQLEVNTASNRLKRLYNLHLVRREHEITNQGLQYIYYFWQWTT